MIDDQLSDNSIKLHTVLPNIKQKADEDPPRVNTVNKLIQRLFKL